ncbi:MAG: hypothetical protein FJX60_12710 [Alphaproteobacteria bacterium]|nr:hypothetical protein [Alphaproteobacteria bacterium]
MTSFVDGFELRFLSQSQSAERKLNGRLLDVIPVAWVASWRNGPPPDMRAPSPDASTAAPRPKASRRPPPREAFVEIRFDDAAEMAAQKTAAPFVVALALARPAGEKARRGVAEFRGVFEVQATGVELSPNSLETKVIRRVTAGEG